MSAAPLPHDNPAVPPIWLRDLFAALAITRLDPANSGSAPAFAKDCYDLADAMLSHRNGETA